MLAGLLLAAGWAARPLPAQSKPAKAAPAMALIAGTVFHDPGLALGGAEVVATAVGGKKKEWKTVSNSRGEFALRVPPGPGSYNVVVKGNGYESQEKSVTLAGDENVDLTFLLHPASGKR